jgi:DHA1 family bicyclomycin/chloramphenicol resistance-like MFS transporter
MFPVGFFTGNFISTRLGGRVSTETMVLAGSLLTITTVTAQAVTLSSGLVAPLAFFIPGFFITMAQGIAMPYGQAAAMSEIPRLAGTAAGIGVFLQNLFAAISSQLYGQLADGTPHAMTKVTLLFGVLTVLVGCIPFLLKRAARAPIP